MTLPSRVFGIGYEIGRRLFFPDATSVALFGMDGGYTPLGTVTSHWFLEDKMKIDSESGKGYRVLSIHSDSAVFTADPSKPDVTLAEALRATLAVEIGTARYECLGDKDPVDITSIWQKRLTQTGDTQ